MKKVTFSRPAGHDVRALDESIREDVKADLEAYSDDPSGFDVIRLEGVDAFRLRVGEYRVIFRETRTAITVLSVRHRSVAYVQMRRKK